MNPKELPAGPIPDTEAAASPENAELIEKYERIKAYAESQKENGFVRVYRAEGDKGEAAFGGQTQLAGTWFSPSFEIAKSFKDRREEDGFSDTKILSLIIPKSMLDGRDAIDAGMNQVNVFNPDLLAGAAMAELPDESAMSIDDYMDQFPFVKDLRARSLI
jgi:hypothetical protein